jgi:hypothetical protein
MSPSTASAPEAAAAPSPTPASSTTCAKPSTPRPMILPASRSRAWIVESSTSTTRDAFSSTTPLASR